MKTKEQIAFAKKLGKRIADVRKERELSQLDLATMAKINEKYLGRVERGESEISAFKLSRVSKVFNVSISDLI